MILPWEIEKNREDVVQAALVVERWCKGKQCRDCPFLDIGGCAVSESVPSEWGLEEYLQNRGIGDE